MRTKSLRPNMFIFATRFEILVLVLVIYWENVMKREDEIKNFYMMKNVIVIWLWIVLFRGVALRIGRFWNRKEGTTDCYRFEF